MHTSLSLWRVRRAFGRFGRLGLVVFLVGAVSASHATEPPVLRWLAVDALPGTGPDCSRLVAPGQKLALVTAVEEPQRAALVFDDGRLLPLLRKTGGTDSPADATPPLVLVERAGRPPAVFGHWPQARCRLDGWSWPGLAPERASSDARFAALVEIAGDTETGMQAGMKPGGLAARAERRRLAQVRVAALFGDASNLSLQLRWRALVAAIDAGSIVEDLGPGEARLRALQAAQGANAHATLDTAAELAGALLTLERHRELLALLDGVLPGARDALGSSHRQVLQLERHRTRALLAVRGGPQSLAAAETLLSVAEAALSTEDPLLFDCRLLLGQALLREGRYVEAIARLEPLVRQVGDERSQRAAHLQDRLAAGYTAAGRLSEGLLAQQRSLLIAEAMLGPVHPDTLRGYNNLANNLRQLNDNETALPLARRAFDGYNGLYGAGHAASVASARGLSLILGELGKPEESLQLIEPQIAAAIQRLGVENRQTLNTRIHQAELLDLVGRHADSVAVLEDVLAPATRVFGESGELTIVAHGILAGGYAGVGDRDRARAQLAIAVERIGRIADQRRALAIMGFAAQTAERIDDQSTLETLLRQFVDIADRADRSGLSEDLASQVQVFRSGPYLRYVAMLAERGEVEAGFDRSERFKGRVLLATLGELAGDASPALPAPVRAELAELRRRVRAAEAEATAAGNDTARVEAGARRESAAQTYLARRAAAKREYPRFAAVADAPVLGSADIARLLADDTCLLSFVVGESRAGVFVLGRSQPIRYFALPAPKDLDGAVNRLRGLWSGESPVPQATEEATMLSRALAPAIAACPQAARKLSISPDGSLALLPFELITAAGAPLGMRYEVSYTQSFSVYGLLRQRPRTARYAQDLLAVGAPTYRSEAVAAAAPAVAGIDAAVRSATLRGAVSSLGQDRTAARRAFDALGLAWQPLPGAEREARMTSALFPRHRLLLGDSAAEDRLADLNRRGELSRYRYLLFATHGYLSPAHPLLSAIVLRQPGSADYDGYLTAAELPLYDLDSELIVLSACETGVGQVRAGSGVMGLPLALMIAGNRNAVVTLWRVPDASAAEFVVRLFRHLRSGQAPAPALAQTKREMALDRRYHDPLHWAGFVLYGVP